MRTLANRELTIAARSASVPVAAFAVLTLSTAFVLLWAPGVPVLAPMNLYEQARLVTWVLVAVASPWAAVRSAAMDRDETLRLLAALAGVRPASAVLAKVLASFTVQGLIMLTAVPGLVLAQQSAAVALSNAFIDLAPLLGLALLIAALSTAATLFMVDRLRAWFLTGAGVTAVLVMAVASGSNLADIGVFCGITGIISAVWLCSTASRVVEYKLADRVR